jgi:two-component sensor histidine kinase
MEPDANRGDDGLSECDPRLFALRHRCRNQIQTMTSLVALFARRQPEGPGRIAFEDMRARFEAVAFDPFGDADPADESPREIDLGALVRRTLTLLDPELAHRVEVEGGAVRASPRRATALAQIVVELVIDLVRAGFGDRPGAGKVTIGERSDGSVRFVIEQDEARATAESAGLGLQIARSVALNLRGSLAHEPSERRRAEVLIPAEAF